MHRTTFTLDEATRSALNRLARERGKSKSAIVREAVLDFEARGDRLAPGERRRRLEALNKYLATPPSAPRSSALIEIAEIRAARKASGLQRP